MIITLHIIYFQKMKSVNIVVPNKYLKPIQMYVLFFMIFKCSEAINNLAIPILSEAKIKVMNSSPNVLFSVLSQVYFQYTIYDSKSELLIEQVGNLTSRDFEPMFTNIALSHIYF